MTPKRLSTRPRMDSGMKNDGIAMVATLSILLVVGLLVLASAITGLIDRSISSNQLRSNSAYYVAMSGLELYKTAVFKNLVDYYKTHGEGWCESPVEGGIKDEFGNVILAPGGWTGDEPFGTGTYRVGLQIQDNYLILTSIGIVGQAQSTVQLVASAGGGPASAWDNAILAQGAEGGSKAINGNVAVYGSVHIVEGDLDGTLAISGTSGVYNTYLGEGGSNSDISDDLSTIVDTNQDLCARLKIAKGNVYLESGSVQLGTSANPIYSVHLGDGIVCKQKETGGGCKEQNIVTDHTLSDSVYLIYPEGGGMNSPYSPYDIGLPALRPEAFTNAFKTATYDGAWVPSTDCSWLYGADGTVTFSAPSSLTTARCGTTTDYIQWDNGVLNIVGKVNIPDADVTVTGDVKYRGQGTLLVGEHIDDATANINISKGSLQPADSMTYLQETGNALGLMTSGNINYESTASLTPSAVLMYAGGVFNALKQPVIVGAVVAEAFDLGEQVPKLAYHPDVKQMAETLCLPGTACAEGEAPQNPGVLSDIAIERR